MALNLIYYGRHSTSPESDTGLIAADASRSCVFDKLTKNIWITDWGFVGGKVSSNATARGSLYEADSSKNPATRVGYFANVTVSTIMVGGGDGTHYTSGVLVSDNGPTNDAIMGYSGKRYAIDIIAGGQSMRHSMVPASAITADNEQFYNRTSPSNPPPTAYGAYSASTEGHLTAYVAGWENVAPFAPSAGLYPTGSISETAPVFTADFKDLNGSWGTGHGGVDTGDVIKQYRIQLRQVGTTTLLWDTAYNATSAEKAADAVSRAYGGSTLTRGVTYEWRMKYSDQFGAYSDYSDWTSFTPADLGYVTLDSDPTGKIESNTPDFKGRWNHQSSTTMKTVQVRIKSSTGTVLQNGDVFDISDVSSSALPGTLFTIPWADTGLSELAWGTSYRYEIRGYDGSEWSDWSTYRTFMTNAAPSIPSSLSPANGVIFSDFPLLTFSMSDSDADDTYLTDLEGIIRITQPDTGTVDVSATYNPTTGKWEFQTTGTELDEFGTYSWAAIGFDGTLYSGEAATLGAGTWSSSNTFVYADGPSVTIDSPASSTTLTTASFDVEWTTTDQVKFKVAVYDAGTTDVVYESNGGDWTVSASDSHTVPSGYVRNGNSYDITVTVQDTTPLDGSSTNTDILVDYTPADPVANFAVTPTAIGNDPWPTANRLSWDQTAYSSPEFLETTIYRQADGGPDAARIILARITTPEQVEFVDDKPASGYEYTYGISVSIAVGLDTLESAIVEEVSTVTLYGVVLTHLTNGTTYRACLLNVRERSFPRLMQESVYMIGRKPVSVRDEARYFTGFYEGILITDSVATAQQRWDEFNELDAQNATVCIRNDWGRKELGKIVDLEQVDDKAGFITYTFSTREENAAEGVT